MGSEIDPSSEIDSIPIFQAFPGKAYMYLSAWLEFVRQYY